jgi:ribosomal protein L37AE/L43A
MELTDWDRCGGYYCPQCHQETVRLKEITPGRWACPICYIKYAEKFSKTEASLEALTNSRDPGLARRAKRYLMKRIPV